ncbi:MAG: hypothetical protein QM589_12405 [Thermomicrobiales bacterium]
MNPVLNRLPRTTRALWKDLHQIADREGRILDDQNVIRWMLLPADPDADVAGEIDALVDAGLLARYEADGVRVLAIPTFLETQRPHAREAPSRLPGPPRVDPGHAQGTPKADPRPTEGDPMADPGRAEGSPWADRGPAEGSAKAPPRLPVYGFSNGEREGSGDGGNLSQGFDEVDDEPRRPTLVPADFRASAETRTVGRRRGMTDRQIDDAIAKFQNFNRGTGRLAVDWQAHARTWLLNERIDGSAGNGAASGTPPPLDGLDGKGRVAKTTKFLDLWAERNGGVRPQLDDAFWSWVSECEAAVPDGGDPANDDVGVVPYSEVI